MTPVFLPEKSHGQRSLVGYSPCIRKESDTTEQVNRHTLPSSLELCSCLRPSRFRLD